MTLTELATHLNLQHPSGKGFPPLLLVTDELRLPDPLAAAAVMPRGTGVIFRHYNDPNRASLAHELAKICHNRRLRLIVAGDGELALRVAAHGIHFPEGRLAETRRWKQRCPGWLITAAAHSLKGLFKAARTDVDAALLGPVFKTKSHSDGTPLGPIRFAALLNRANRSLNDFPVYALGGMNAETTRRIHGCGAIGVAAISALSNPQDEGV